MTAFMIYLWYELPIDIKKLLLNLSFVENGHGHKVYTFCPWRSWGIELHRPCYFVVILITILWYGFLQDIASYVQNSSRSIRTLVSTISQITQASLIFPGVIFGGILSNVHGFHNKYFFLFVAPIWKSQNFVPIQKPKMLKIVPLKSNWCCSSEKFIP